MAILSESEFEAVLSRMINKIDKILYARHTYPKLEKVRRVLKDVHEIMVDPDKEKPSPEQLKGLAQATESLRGMSLGDPSLDDDSFDVEDYVTYRM